HIVLFLSSSVPHRSLHSFPTRRSSDLIGTSKPLSFWCHTSWPSRSGSRSDFCIAENHAGAPPMSRTTLQTLSGDWRSEIVLVARSEEHTSELQSRPDSDAGLLLEKKKK